VLRIRAERRAYRSFKTVLPSSGSWPTTGFTAIQVIDRFHVDERLAQLCEAWCKSTRSDTAIDRICRSLNRLATYRESDAAQAPSEWYGRARQSISGERANIAWDNLAYLN
jgi:hypothetical protein